MNICIVLVNYNGLEDTRRCLQSLDLVRQQPGVTVMMVDNASSVDPTPVLEVEFPWCHTVRNAVNGGWAGGNNTGIRYALDHKADLIVLLNNDTTVAPDFVPRLLAAANAYPHFGIIGPVIRYMEPPHEVMTDGALFNAPTQAGFLSRKAVDLVALDTPPITEVDIVNGCCMMVRAEVFERVGLVDERFFLVHEESDLCLRAQQAGFRCGVIGEALVWHKGSSSFKRTGRRFQRYYDARNLLLLLRKHPNRNGRRRGSLPSLWEYFRYVYYRYTIERESRQQETADAVIEGFCDGASQYFGPFQQRSHPVLPLIRCLFNFWHDRRQAQQHQGA